eukprot:6210967-Pleurochrysis_carterae.AAC.1
MFELPAVCTHLRQPKDRQESRLPAIDEYISSRNEYSCCLVSKTMYVLSKLPLQCSGYKPMQYTSIVR